MGLIRVITYLHNSLHVWHLQAFPGCVFGVSHIGYVMVGYGCVNALASVLVGPLEKLINRKLMFLLATAFNMIVFAVVMLWQPEDGPNAVFYVLPVVWGMADAIWQVTSLSKQNVYFLRCFQK